MSNQPLTDSALKRLRALASGNGLEPDTISVKSSDEKHVTLTGKLVLTPKAEITTKRFHGKGSSAPKVKKTFASFAELSSYMTEEQNNFSQKGSWFDAVKADLDKQPGKGWGLQDARIVLDDMPNLVAAAAETCTPCSGQGALLCDYCAGRGQTPCRACGERGSERCYNCYGTGQNPQDNSQPCFICNGSAFIVCRTCMGHRGIACGNCRSSGQMQCKSCNGGGQTIEVKTLSYGADVHFSPGSSAELPAAMRRGLDRAGGIKSLANGHADIDYTIPRDDEQPKRGVITINYTAALACADIVMLFNKEPKRIAVFGHKKVLLDVPAFLDGSLQDAVSLLGKAAKGEGKISPALKYRAIGEISELILSGNARLPQLKRLYPHGLSKPMMQSIVQKVRGALARMTRVSRWAGLVTAAITTDILSGALYFTSLHQSIIKQGGRGAGLATELLLPVLCAVLGYVCTNQAALLHLRRSFPNAKIRSHRHGGKLAYIAAVICFIMPFGLSVLATKSPLWFSIFGLK